MSINSTAPSIDATEISYMKRIDLNDYYKHDAERCIIHCEICRCDISKDYVLKHTVSKRHKYNKLLIGILQDCSQNEDVDFIVQNIDRLRCRYCNVSIIIVNDEDDLITSHIETTKHKIKRQNYLNTGISNSLKPLDSMTIHSKKFKNMNRICPKIQIQKSYVTELKQHTTELLNISQDSGNNVVIDILPEYIVINKNGRYECRICLKEIPDSNFNRNQHLSGKNHKKNLQELMNVNKVGNDIKSLTYSKKGTIRSEVVLPEYVVINKNGGYECRICLKGIPDSNFNINQHVSGKKHKEKLQELMNVNKVKIILELLACIEERNT